MGKALVRCVELGWRVVTSLRYDARLLGIRVIPLWWRVRFLEEKYRCVACIALGRKATFRLGPLRFRAPEFHAIAAFQFTIIDVYEAVVTAGLLVGPEPCVVDVGANIGQYCNAIKVFAPDARILSVEPNPYVFEDLEFNTALLPGVTLVNLAAGSRSGTLPLARHAYSDSSSLVDQGMDRIAEAGPVDVVEVLVEPLDAVVPRDWRPDLVKIDVEGFEREAVAGAIDVLARSRWLCLELGLSRFDLGESNIGVLHDLFTRLPDARIVRFGRPLGGSAARPDCQDVIVQLSGERRPD